MKQHRDKPAGMTPGMATKKFDLNIERVLEDWGVHSALREVIANALDEQALTKTKNVEIIKDRQGRWHVRDYGRGLKYVPSSAKPATQTWSAQTWSSTASRTPT
jgi:DNA gyrase/topoisomerase IV subunit B